MRAVIFILSALISFCGAVGSYAADDVRADYKNSLFNCHATSEEEYNRSLESWNNEAKKGNLKTARGMCSLGRQKCRGIIGDIALIKERCLEQAEKGEREAQKIMALILKDKPSESLKWHLKAARQNPKMVTLENEAEDGNADSQFALGMYYHCLDRPIGTNERFKWWNRAAEQGNGRAQNAMGYVFNSGSVGVKQDIEEAYFWYSLASKKGHSDAQAQWRISKKLSPQRVAVIKERVQKWKPSLESGAVVSEKSAPVPGWLKLEAGCRSSD